MLVKKNKNKCRSYIKYQLFLLCFTQTPVYRLTTLWHKTVPWRCLWTAWRCSDYGRTCRCCCSWWGTRSWTFTCWNCRRCRCRSSRRLGRVMGCWRWRIGPGLVWISRPYQLKIWNFLVICLLPSVFCRTSMPQVCTHRISYRTRCALKSMCQKCCRTVRGIFWLKSCFRTLWKLTLLTWWPYLRNTAQLTTDSLKFCSWTLHLTQMMLYWSHWPRFLLSSPFVRSMNFANCCCLNSAAGLGGTEKLKCNAHAILQAHCSAESTCWASKAFCFSSTLCWSFPACGQYQF